MKTKLILATLLLATTANAGTIYKTDQIKADKYGSAMVLADKVQEDCLGELKEYDKAFGNNYSRDTCGVIKKAILHKELTKANFSDYTVKMCDNDPEHCEQYIFVEVTDFSKKVE